MNKLAFALVGGICSGKTTFAEEMTNYDSFLIISKDWCIYESDMLCRDGISKSWEELREEKIDALVEENVILDETIRVGKLDKLKSKGYTIVAILMESDKAIRSRRLLKRNELNRQYFERLKVITGIDLLKYTQTERRDMWRNPKFRKALPLDKQSEFDRILERLYLLGSKVLKDEEPNPVCFSQIDYIVKAEDLRLTRDMNIEDILSQCISYEEYKREWAKNVKYCIWDVGGVFYHYSTDILHNWGIQHSKDKITSKRQFSFNDYMRGVVSFEDVCRNFCMTYNVEFRDKYIQEITDCLYAGIGELYSETEQMIEYVKSKNVVNCILSNALPILADDGNYPHLIDSVNRFYSFVFHKLKPENDIYKMMQEKLGVPFDRMIFIDDKKRNVDAAIDLGIYSIEFNRETIKQELESIFE